MISEILAIIAAVLLVLYLLKQKGVYYPPGPIALPIIGNLVNIYISGSLAQFVKDNRKIYGDVSTNVSATCKY